MENKPSKPVFIPSEFAKKNCRTCGGDGTIRLFLGNPKDNNITVQPCGCATKRYMRTIRDLP